MARQLKSIECSAQPLCISFHPFRDVVAAGLVDGTVEGEMISLHLFLYSLCFRCVMVDH